MSHEASSSTQQVTPKAKKGPTVFPTPVFKKEVVQNGRCDGYWVETFHFDPSDKHPSLLAHGLISGDITFFLNPENEPIKDTGDTPDDNTPYTQTKGGAEKNKHPDPNKCKPAPQDPKSRWKQYTIGVFDSPVAVTTADVAGNGRMDVIVCFDYGNSIWDAYPDGGTIMWLENPGREKFKPGKHWKKHFIGRWPVMHRMKAGYFTQSSVLELIGLSIVAGSNDFTTPIPIVMFSRPEKVEDAIEWPRTIIDDENYFMIHDVAKHSFDSKSQRGRESFFMSSMEGMNWMNFTKNPPQWNADLIGHGTPPKPGRQYYGEACVEMASGPGDAASYFITVGPFHEGTVTAYTKKITDPFTIEWVGHVLDIHGTPEQHENEATGPGHYVASGDFDGDGVDELLVAFMGPAPEGRGVFYYKPVDLANGIFAKWKVADESAARIAVGDFSGNGTLDFATIEYNVPNYFEWPNPRIHVYYNQFGTPVQKESQILSTIWADKPMFFLPTPETIKGVQVVSFFEIAGYKVSVEVAGPDSLPAGVLWGTAAIRMLWGELKDDQTVHSVMNVDPFKAATARIYGRILKPGPKGAAYIRFSSLVGDDTRAGWKLSNQVPVKSLFKPTYETIELPDGTLKFRQYDTKEPKRLFYNLTGFHFRFKDSRVNLCHMQFWNASKGVNCGVHNHESDIFCELHLCLFAGTGNGGMWKVKDGVEVDPKNPNGTSNPDDFDKLPLKTLEQHGRLWKVDCKGVPVRRKNTSVDYPWHKWQAGDEKDGLDIWVAFEYNPDLDYSSKEAETSSKAPARHCC